MTQYGFFSAKAAEIYGSVIWQKPDGTEVEITASGENIEDYKWNDAVCVGEVTKWVRGTLDFRTD